MDHVSRRTFFKQAGAAAALAGAATVLPTPAFGSTVKLSDDEARQSEPMVAHVTDAGSGRISLFVGDREIEIHDRAVAARLVRAAR